MNRDLLRELSALAAGLVFGAGLVVSGMTRPDKVLGFLDVFGAWDASLMLWPGERQASARAEMNALGGGCGGWTSRSSRRLRAPL